MRRGLAALAALALGLTGCGGKDKPSTGKRIDAYVRDANAAQARAQPVIAGINDAYKQYAEGKLKGTDAALRLKRAEVDLAGVQRSVQALRPPVEARRLHDLLVQTYVATVALAHETSLQAVYVPEATRILQRLDPIRKRLRDRLGSTKAARRQAGALRTYAGQLGSVHDELAKLTPPAVLVSTNRGQLERLTRAGRLALDLVSAIRAQDSERLAKGLKAFRAAGDTDPQAAGLARGGVLAYTQRLNQVTRLAGDVARERARLIKAYD